MPEYFQVSIAPNEARWGTYAVCLDVPLTNDAEAAAYLQRLLPEIVPRWREWRRGLSRGEELAGGDDDRGRPIGGG